MLTKRVLGDKRSGMLCPEKRPQYRENRKGMSMAGASMSLFIPSRRRSLLGPCSVCRAGFLAIDTGIWTGCSMVGTSTLLMPQSPRPHSPTPPPPVGTAKLQTLPNVPGETAALGDAIFWNEMDSDG